MILFIVLVLKVLVMIFIILLNLFFRVAISSLSLIARCFILLEIFMICFLSFLIFILIENSGILMMVTPLNLVCLVWDFTLFTVILTYIPVFVLFITTRSISSFYLLRIGLIVNLFRLFWSFDMSCYRPMCFTVPLNRHGKLTKDVLVPCNYCLSCRITRSIYLRSLASYEVYMCALQGRGSSFSTLTFCDYNLPISLDSGLPTLARPELTNFIKRLRKSLPKDLQSFKYMASGEYGDQFGRPHFHFTPFGLPASYASKAIFNAWNNPETVDYTGVIRGTTDTGALRAGGMSYVTKYCLKQIRGKEVTKLYDNNFVEPPFIVHSKELEKQFVLRELDELRKSHWKSNFFGRPSFVPVRVMKKYGTLTDVAMYQGECIRYLKSRSYNENVLKTYAKERSAYFSALNNGEAVDNDVLIHEYNKLYF